MTKTLMRALIVGVFAVVAWQMGGTTATPTYAEVHTGNLHDCDDFNSQSAAQAHLDEQTGDPDNLDSDDDDIACENFDYDDDDDVDTCGVYENCVGSEFANCGGYICGNYCPSGNCGNTNCVAYQCGNQYCNYYNCGNNCVGNQCGVNCGNASCGNYCATYNCANCTVANCGNSNCVAVGCGNYCGGTAYCPPYDVSAPSRPDHLSLKAQKTSLACNEATTVVARVTFGNGIGAPAHMVTFQATQGTAFTNLLTDAQGYVNTTYVAPSTPTSVTLTAFADGMTQTQTISVTCTGPTLPPPLGITYVSPISPPSTGDGGLMATEQGSSGWLYLGAILLVISVPVFTFAVVRQRS